MSAEKEEYYRKMSRKWRWDWDSWNVWSYFRFNNKIIQEMMAECLGTFILVTFGNGAVAQSVLSRETKGGFLSVNFAYGLGVTMAVFLTGNISGAHINPAVSLALTVMGKLPLYKLPAYVFSQVLGGFLSGAIVYLVYIDAIISFSPNGLQVDGINGTAGIFATYPSSFLSIGNGFWDQVFATSMLVMLVFAITDPINNKIAPGVKAISLGFVVLVIGLSFGYNCGYAINPARDFGPRLFTLCAGWGTEVFWAGNSWWWVPIVGPLLGAVVGAVVYQVTVHIQLEQREIAPMKSNKYSEQVNFSEMDGNAPEAQTPAPPGPTRL